MRVNRTAAEHVAAVSAAPANQTATPAVAIKSVANKSLVNSGVANKGAANRTSKTGIKGNSASVKFARSVHIYLSILMLVVLVFFALTGITLNHTEWVGQPTQRHFSWQLTVANEPVTTEPVSTEPVSTEKGEDSASNDLPAALRSQLAAVTGLSLAHATVERDETLYLLDLQLAGEQWQLEVDSESGTVQATQLDYGWLAKLNDWHKGRHTPALWNALLDVMAGLIILFCLSGLWLLLPNKKKLWPVLGWGVAGTALWFASLLVN